MPAPIDIAHYLGSVARTEEYVTHRAKAERSPSETEKLQARNTAIRMGALALADRHTNENDYRTPEGDMYNLVAHVDGFAKAQLALDTMPANATRKERMTQKIEIIKFNHALKEAIDNNPSLGFNQTLRFLTQTYVSINGSEKAQSFMDSARIVLVGMQHELATEQIIGTMKDTEVAYDVDYDDPRIDRTMGAFIDKEIKQELNGVDMFVTMHGVTFPIDVKASRMGVANSQAKSPNPELIVWSQCSNADFGDSFRIAPELAKAKATGLHEALEQACYNAPEDKLVDISA